VQSWLSDARYAVRTLLKSPGFTAVAVLTLALGIGANSAIFSVVNGVVLKPLEYRAPDKLVLIMTQFPTMGFDKFWISAPEYLEYREWNRSFEEVGLFNTGRSSIHGEDQPLRVTTAVVTAELFDVLGVEAIHGRAFDKEEDAPGAEPVLVLSYELWLRAFGGDPAVVGEGVEVNGIRRTILGVMPPRFDINDNQIEAWLPMALDPAEPPGRALTTTTRLAASPPASASERQGRSSRTSWGAGARRREAPTPRARRIIR